MEWIEIQLRKLRQRHQQKSRQLSQENQSKVPPKQSPTAANENWQKAKTQSKEAVETLKKHSPSKPQTVTKIDAPSSGGTKTTSGYQPKGLPPRSTGKGKGRSR